MIQDVLAAHFAEYPFMDAQDAVKLLYQMEFGPEHMITDESKSLRMLEEEMAALGARLPGERMYESIGNGLCRWNLRPCSEKGIPAADIHRLFADAARHTRGDRNNFRRSLHLLQEMAENDETPFEPIQLDLFLARYNDRSCPPVHHSQRYHAAYHPAYRIVSQKKLKDYLAQLRGQEK